MRDHDATEQLQQRVRAAVASRTPLCITGSGSKTFYGREPVGEPLSTRAHRGIVNYEPTELVITARSGTPLVEIETTLAAQRQMLAFEPPHFGPQATLGGTIATNFSGPRRPHAGAARDFVLGCRLINGRGELLHFGGEVMKNVAGYDVSRLQCGALGTLGILLEVSLKVLPRPAREITRVLELDPAAALQHLHRWACLPLPVSASCHVDGRLYLRLEGSAEAIEAASATLGGDILEDTALWHEIREQQHPFFADERPLWRLSLPSDTPPLSLPGQWLYEWGGSQRWLLSTAPAEDIRAAAHQAGGHATVFRRGDRQQAFQPLPATLLHYHRRLKQAFDPHGLFNPGRLYPEL